MNKRHKNTADNRASAMQLITGLTLMLLLWATPVAAEKLIVVTHANLGANTFTHDQVKAVYMGKTKFLNNTRLKPVEYNPRSALMGSFLGKLGISQNTYLRHWVKEIFRSGATPPRQVVDPDEAMRIVRNTPGAIGFFPASWQVNTDGLKRVITLDD
jgi:ABC-type phosphate transport system substrate-binding protein